jgi:hypothetical protein
MAIRLLDSFQGAPMITQTKEKAERVCAYAEAD